MCHFVQLAKNIFKNVGGENKNTETLVFGLAA
jgi:hypothetical protein